jgi:hypothetical protein
VAYDIHCFVEYRLNWSGREPYWHSLSDSELDVCAERNVVAALSGQWGNALVSARGFPTDASGAARDAYFEPQSGQPHDWFYWPGWLTRQEVEDALALYEPAPSVLPPLRAVVAAMRALEAELGADAVRLVFWLS